MFACIGNNLLKLHIRRGRKQRPDRNMTLQNHPMWRKPQHHLDLENASDHVHWVELFYDLIHVVTIFMLGNYLSHHLGWEGFLVFAGLFTALWFAWGDLSAFNSLYVSTDMGHRVIMAVLICTIMFMAASIPTITDKGWPFFMLAYGANRALLALLYLRARRAGAEMSSLCDEMVRNFGILAVVFAISAFLPSPIRYWVFAAGVATIQLLYMLPGIGVLRLERFIPRLGHMSERFALLTLIVLGEGFFKLVLTLSEKGVYKVSPDVFINFIFGGLSIFVLCWIYFDFVGNARPRNRNTVTLVGLWLAHLLLMMCGVMIGVALTGEVKVGFFEPFPIEYAAIGCFGLAGYILAIWILQLMSEAREAHLFTSTWLRVSGIGLAILTYLTVPYVPTLAGNLIWGAALFSQIVVPLMLARKHYIQANSGN